MYVTRRRSDWPGSRHDGERSINANRASSFGGGYETTMLLTALLPAQPVYPVYLGNTVDALRWRRRPAPGLWHICHFHGLGFSLPNCPSPSAMSWPDRTEPQMIWIGVDNLAALHDIPAGASDTGTRALNLRPEFRLTALPLRSDLDDEGRKLGPIAFLAMTNLLRQLERGHLAESTKVGSKSNSWKTSPPRSTSILSAESHVNGGRSCARGQDEDHSGRRNHDADQDGRLRMEPAHVNTSGVPSRR